MNDTTVFLSALGMMLTISLLAYFKLAPGRKTLPISVSWKGEAAKEAPRLLVLLQIPAIAAPMMLLFPFFVDVVSEEPNVMTPVMASVFINHQLYHLWLIHKWAR